VKTEHPAVREAAEYCRQLGCNVLYLPVNADGVLDIDAARASVSSDTIMVAVMAVNNETGVVQDLRAISEIAHRHGALFMTDATQAYGKLPLDVDALGIDILTLSGHKIYGPKGVGALYIRSRKEFLCPIEPMIRGGGQEFGFRSGTLNVPGIVGLAVAGEIALESCESETRRLNELRERFEQGVLELPGTQVNGAGACRNYNISNITFNNVDVVELMREMKHVACSKGSACSTSKSMASMVLLTMGLSELQADSSLRFSFGRTTTEDHVIRLLQEVKRAHALHFKH
jgi:cysteine desulfurase